MSKRARAKVQTIKNEKRANSEGPMSKKQKSKEEAIQKSQKTMEVRSNLKALITYLKLQKSNKEIIKWLVRLARVRSIVFNCFPLAYVVYFYAVSLSRLSNCFQFAQRGAG